MSTVADHTHEQQYEPSLAMSRGRLAMWLFIATEVMFFTALLAAYIVLRFGADAWPSGATMHVDRTLGTINTFVLLASGVVVSVAARNLTAGNRLSARVWLLLAALLGMLFVGIKGFEYRDKIQHNLYPARPRGPVFEQADAYYLAAVRARVQTLQAEFRAAGDSPEVVERLAWLEGFETSKLLPAEVGLRDVPVSEAAREECDYLATMIYPPPYPRGLKGLNEQNPWLQLPVVIPGGRLWISTYFLLTGAHLVHLIVAIIVASWWVVVGLRRTSIVVVENLALYWHLVDVVWIVLFGVIYFT